MVFLSFLFIVFFYKLMMNLEPLGVLFNEVPEPAIFAVINVLLYFFAIVLVTVGRCRLNSRNIQYFIQTNNVILVISICMAFWGAHHLWSEKCFRLIQSRRAFFEDIITAINGMIWVRLIYLLFLVFLIIFLCCYLVCMVTCGTSQIDFLNRRSVSRNNRLPLVTRFLQERARSFNPA